MTREDAAATTGRYRPRHAGGRRPMDLTFAGYFVVACLILTAIFVVIGVVARVISGQWDAEKVIGTGFFAWFVALLMLSLWRWE